MRSGTCITPSRRGKFTTLQYPTEVPCLPGPSLPSAVGRRRALPLLHSRLSWSGTASTAAPGDIAVTGGYLNMVRGAGALVITGDRGFSVNGGVSAAAGIFVPYSYCILLDGPCSPGDTVSLRALWSGTDAPGRFTLDGVTYGSANMASMRLAFDGLFLLPPLADSATVVAPFVFEGGLSVRAGVQPAGGDGEVVRQWCGDCLSSASHD